MSGTKGMVGEIVKYEEDDFSGGDLTYLEDDFICETINGVKSYWRMPKKSTKPLPPGVRVRT